MNRTTISWHVPRAFDLCTTYVGIMGRDIIILASSVSENTFSRTRALGPEFLPSENRNTSELLRCNAGSATEVACKPEESHGR